LAWGHWRLAANDVSHNLTLAHAALDAGIDFFDTADIYGFDGTTGFRAADAFKLHWTRQRWYSGLVAAVRSPSNEQFQSTLRSQLVLGAMR